MLITKINITTAVASTAVAGASLGGAFSNSRVSGENTRYLKQIIQWACHTFQLNQETLSDDSKKADADWHLNKSSGTHKPSKSDIEAMCTNLTENSKWIQHPNLKENELADQVSRLNNKFLEATLWSVLEYACISYEAMKEVEGSYRNTLSGGFGTSRDNAADMCSYVPKSEEYEKIKKKLIELNKKHREERNRLGLGEHGARGFYEPPSRI
ncbi:hypothetical protein [Candidatus Mycoplasma haematohominis]|uniref:hypothetical protein n=1 Tax=Candidatus Mycoplasma haematohominis TaxID=1494318 RepID=UPI001C0A7490|nr:hypothetical protein [Candidatus Mycoplasma haemohominis]